MEMDLQSDYNGSTSQKTQDIFLKSATVGAVGAGLSKVILPYNTLSFMNKSYNVPLVLGIATALGSVAATTFNNFLMPKIEMNQPIRESAGKILDYGVAAGS